MIKKGLINKTTFDRLTIAYFHSMQNKNSTVIKFIFRKAAIIIALLIVLAVVVVFLP